MNFSEKIIKIQCFNIYLHCYMIQKFKLKNLFLVTNLKQFNQKMNNLLIIQTLKKIQEKHEFHLNLFSIKIWERF